jgi:hypothetical protein
VIYIGQPGLYTFSINDTSYGYIHVDWTTVFDDTSGGQPVTIPIYLEQGWHDIDYYVYTTSPVLRYAPPNGPDQVIPDSVLRRGNGFQGRIDEVSDLLSQADLRYLSLRGQVIHDVRPLTKMNGLEILDLQNNWISNIEDLTGQRLIDDGDQDFEVLDTWLTNLSAYPDAFEDDYRFREGVGDDNAAKWTFRDLDPGEYEVLVTWPEAFTRTEQAKYFVRGSNTAVVVDLGQDLFQPVISPAGPEPWDGERTVVIDTDVLTISGDDDDPLTFYGTPFVVDTVGDLARFFVLGDLHIGGDKIVVVGSRALSIQVGNDVIIDPDAQFHLSADGPNPGPGGGAGGPGGVGGAAGAGGTNGVIFVPLEGSDPLMFVPVPGRLAWQRRFGRRRRQLVLVRQHRPAGHAGRQRRSGKLRRLGRLGVAG